MHTLKGTSGTLGLIQLERISKNIETNLKHGHQENLQSDFNDLFKAFDDFILMIFRINVQQVNESCM